MGYLGYYVWLCSASRVGMHQAMQMLYSELPPKLCAECC